MVLYEHKRDELHPQGPQDIAVIDSRQIAHCGSGASGSFACGGALGAAGGCSITRETFLRFLAIGGGDDADNSTTSSSVLGGDDVRSTTGPLSAS